MMDYFSHSEPRLKLADRIAVWAESFAQRIELPYADPADYHGYVITGTSEHLAGSLGGVSSWEPYGAQPAGWSPSFQYFGHLDAAAQLALRARPVGERRLLPAPWFYVVPQPLFATENQVSTDFAWSVATGAPNVLPEWLQDWYRARAAREGLRLYLHWLKRQGKSVWHLVNTWASLQRPHHRRPVLSKRKLAAASLKTPRRRSWSAHVFAPRHVKRQSKNADDADASPDHTIDRDLDIRLDQFRGLDRLH